MKKNPLDSSLLGVSIFGFLLCASSILLMPEEDLLLLPGILFWLGLLLGVGTQIALNCRRKAFFAKHQADVRKMQKRRCGCFHLFSNHIASVADTVLLASVLGAVLSIWYTEGLDYICYVFIALVIFAFSMHCILNGRNYHHVMHYSQILQAVKRNQSVSEGEGEK